MVIRYRVHTEHVSPALVGRYFEGFTILDAAGFYKGKPESSKVIEVLGTAEDLDKVKALALDIREQYRQAEVWITSEPVNLLRVSIDAIREGIES
jgi:hypothetical protein